MKRKRVRLYVAAFSLFMLARTWSSQLLAHTDLGQWGYEELRIGFGCQNTSPIIQGSGDGDLFTRFCHYSGWILAIGTTIGAAKAARATRRCRHESRLTKRWSQRGRGRLVGRECLGFLVFSGRVAQLGSVRRRP
jgi:hypothetical protein